MTEQQRIATAQITDACIKEKVAFFMPPVGITSVLSPELSESMLSGPVVPVRHNGSVSRCKPHNRRIETVRAMFLLLKRRSLVLVRVCERRARNLIRCGVELNYNWKHGSGLY